MADELFWNGARVAQELGYKYNYFMNKVRYWPGVPQPVDKPGHPRWRPADWREWSSDPARFTQKQEAA